MNQNQNDETWREYRRRSNYGLDAGEYQMIFESQGGVCAICGQEETKLDRSGKVQPLAIDHDHKCCPGARSCGACVRGLLCSACNVGIGHMNEDVDRLFKAMLYIAQYEDEALYWKLRYLQTQI